MLPETMLEKAHHLPKDIYTYDGCSSDHRVKKKYIVLLDKCGSSFVFNKYKTIIWTPVFLSTKSTNKSTTAAEYFTRQIVGVNVHTGRKERAGRSSQ